MAFITDILNTIKNARKGKDMRQAIYDGIRQCYNDATGHPESVAATVKEIGEVSANLSKETADRKAEVNTERKRIDNLIKELPATAGEYQQSKLVLHSYDNTAVKCTTTSGNYTNVPAFTTDQGGPLSSLYTKKSNYQIAVNKSGLYLLELRIHVNSLIANKRVELAPFVNDTRNAALASSYNTAGNFTLTQVAALPLWLSANDTVDFRIAPIDAAEVSLQLGDVLVYAIDWENKFKIPDYTGYAAETKDIRTGADGTVYGTAGEAVRKQIGNLTEDINEQTGSYLQGKQLFNANDFSIGACTSGLKTESQFRITNAKETFEKSTPIKCKIGDALNINVDLANSDFIGCRVGIHEISNSYFVSDSGWLQVTNKGVSYTVKHKSTIGVNVSFSFSKNSNTVITNSTEYTGELTLDKLLSNIKISVVMGDSVVSNVQLGEMYNNLKKAITMPRMIYKSDPSFDIFLNAESKYRLQGCTVGKEFLYYSMTEQDNSNSYIYKVSLSNGELVSSSAGKYGHAGDMTFNPNTNEIITLTAEISYTDLFILDADTLLLKKTIRVNTEGWRLATIAYNPYTKGYVAEFAKNNTWSEYKFAFTDTNFSIISGFNSIKQGYTLQGIECDGRYVYAMYAYPNIVIVYDVNGSYVGYIKIPFTTESECIAKHNDILFIGEDGEKKIYKVQLQYEWDD